MNVTACTRVALFSASLRTRQMDQSRSKDKVQLTRKGELHIREKQFHT
jgi:hypothetical protein